MTIVAEEYGHVMGVDTHARTHTYAIVDTSTGACLVSESFPTTAAGIQRAIAWAKRNSNGTVLAAVEGTSSYGAGLTRALKTAGIPVAEVKPPGRQARAGVGKSDPIDAVEAARQVLHRDVDRLAAPRADGLRAALRVLLTGRKGLDTRRTADRNALNALARTSDLGVDARKALTAAQVTMIAGWGESASTPVDQQIARQEATRLAAAVKDADRHLRRIKAQLKELVEQLAPGFLTRPGIGPVTAAVILCAYSHHGRIRSESAFAALAGVSPLPASSGNTVRHRLNRHGDRQLNMALDIIVKVRMVRDETTRRYIERRTGEGRTYREIKRALKRYTARAIFRELQTLLA
ncbi:IS110 family transposase [Arthrobacter sp. ISL-30]|uniref:IS110 family transposase n=1 Tax=Arthrobacter sp. ISL-30 TaxID=2819109 RepID=UPI001BEC9AA7|nr:IS110 family transposase [Arthrobacter sp. ISL-30]MBT2514679.1 IS110 family transposase [Arthrobacter sp. ISL-30]